MARRVVYFTDSSIFGGSEQVLLTLIAHLDRTRWEPFLFHHAEPGLAPLVERARQLHVEMCQVPRMRGAGGAGRLPGFVRQLAALRPAVFHANLTMPLDCKYGLAGAVLARVPAIVATEHLFLEIPWRTSRLIERVIAFGVHGYVAVSNQVARQLAQALPFLSPKMRVVHNGIALEPFDHLPDPALRKELGCDGTFPLVMTVARLTEQKGIRYLLDAATQVPEARFVIVGEGPERATLEAQARTLDMSDRVVFMGARQDVPELLQSCDLFVLPSLYEGLPLSILEAMAAGRATIATDVGGTGEAVGSCETGLLVPPADPDALAGAIRMLLADPERASRLGAAAQARVRAEFSAERMTERIVAIYDSILRARGSV